MEDIPPSYYQSTNPSVLDLIAPYLDTASLHSLVLVSRLYNETFMPHLWGSPASHFVPVTGLSSPGLSRTHRGPSSYDDMVYVALTRFKRILKIARWSTRRLVHTLYLPAAASEIYSGPNATWLREILDGLPNLQSLCVSNLPFFDHHSLMAVDRNKSSSTEQHFLTYPVKLLLASKEPNTTSIGLSLLLPHLSSLVYLDLSHTTPARDMNVLSSLSALVDLQVLKLRGVGLRDAEAEVLANAIGLRVRLLDVADNFLGDTSVRTLLQTCFVHPTDNLDQGDQSNGRINRNPSQLNYHSRRHLESWPVGLPPAPDFLSLDILRSAEFDKNLLVQLTSPLTGRLAFEDIPHSGITHLYINGNAAVTIEGVKSLLELGRLHVLDAGDVSGETAVDKYVRSVRDSGKWHGRTKSVGSGGASITVSHLSGGRGDGDSDERLFVEDDFHLPGAEKLIPVLKEKASKNLTYLRIEHSVITKEFDVTKEPEKAPNGRVELLGSTSRAAELNGSLTASIAAEVPGSNNFAVEAPGSRYHAVEMPSESSVFELDATPVMRAELPGDPIHFAISPPVGDKPDLPASDMAVVSPIRGEGAFAPEVVTNDQRADDQSEEVVLDATGSGVKQRSLSPTSPSPLLSSATEDNNKTIDTVIASPQASMPQRPRSLSSDYRSQMQMLLKSRPKPTSPILHPSSVSNLRTLLLTNIPAEVAGVSSPVLKSIKNFIAACATEARIAVLQAQTNYSLPPGRARAAAERKHALSLFALRTIVLEVSPVQDTRQRDWKHTRQRLNISKSSTGDHDSEALWSAAENDFSFFGEEGEEHDECGIYEHEPGKYFPSIHLDDKFAVTADDVSTPSSSNFTINSPSTGTIFRSPRELPLGRNRRASNEPRITESALSPIRSVPMEMPGSTPTSQPRQLPPTSAPKKAPDPEPMVDLIAELSKWRKERKAAYEEEVRQRSRVNGVTVASRLADTEVYVEGHWKGEIKVVRNAKPTGSGTNRGQGRLERNGMVDIYGNYFEKGYLYS